MFFICQEFAKTLLFINIIATYGFRVVFDEHRCAVYDLTHANVIVLTDTL